ncbi:MAG: histidine kinase [Pirellulaceae bacterium]|nr:histidine kinase [Pirellulaceae bacterium]
MGSEGNEKDRLIQALRVEIRQQQSSLHDIEAALHDGPMQRVIAAHMQLQSMLAVPELTNERLQELESIDQMLTTAIEQTREIIGGEASAEIVLDGVDDLEKLCLSLTSDSFAVRLVADDLWKQIPLELQTPVLLLIRESVWNSRKHSGAAEVFVALSGESPTVEIVIEDRGCGFVVEFVDVDKFGLCTMMQRAKNHGIDLLIESTPRQGTRIVIKC